MTEFERFIAPNQYLRPLRATPTSATFPVIPISLADCPFGREYQYNPPGGGGRWLDTSSNPRKQTSNLAGILTTPLSFLAKAFTVTRHIRFRASINDHLPRYHIDALTPPGVRSEFGD